MGCFHVSRLLKMMEINPGEEGYLGSRGSITTGGTIMSLRSLWTRAATMVNKTIDQQ